MWWLLEWSGVLKGTPKEPGGAAGHPPTFPEDHEGGTYVALDAQKAQGVGRRVSWGHLSFHFAPAMQTHLQISTPSKGK